MEANTTVCPPFILYLVQYVSALPNLVLVRVLYRNYSSDNYPILYYRLTVLVYEQYQAVLNRITERRVPGGGTTVRVRVLVRMIQILYEYAARVRVRVRVRLRLRYSYCPIPPDRTVPPEGLPPSQRVHHPPSRSSETDERQRSSFVNIRVAHTHL